MLVRTDQIDFTISQEDIEIVRSFCEIQSDAFTQLVCQTIRNRNLAQIIFLCKTCAASIKKNLTVQYALVEALFDNGSAMLDIIDSFVREDALNDELPPQLLRTAVSNGNIDIIKYFYENDRFNLKSFFSAPDEASLLEIAVKEGQYSVVKYLCETHKAAENRAKDSNISEGTKALHIVCNKKHSLSSDKSIKQKNLEIAQYLCSLKQGVNINQKIYHHSSLYHAATHNEPEIVKLLLQQPTLDFSHVVQAMEVLKNIKIYSAIEAEVKKELQNISVNHNLHPLVNYFKEWRKSHWCWQRIHPNRYVFAYMLLKSPPEQCPILLNKIMNSGQIHSWCHKSFKNALNECQLAHGNRAATVRLNHIL